MSIECQNTAPLASGNNGAILKETSDALQNAILDLSSLVPDDTDPLANLDRESIIDTTNALNNILKGLDDETLGQYPSIQDKLNDDKGIQPTDIAQFALDTSTNISELRDSLVAFNEGRANSSGTDLTTTVGAALDTTGKIDTGSGDTSVIGDANLSTISTGGAGTGTGAGGTGTGTGAGAGTGTGGTGTGTGGADTTGITDTTPSTSDASFVGNDDRANRIDRTFTSTADATDRRIDALAVLVNSRQALPVLITNLLGDLDFNFAQNLGQKLTSSVCGAYNDVLEKLTKAFAVVKTGQAVINNVENLLEKDLKKLAESIKQKGVLETLMDLLKQVIEGAVNAAKKVAMAAVGSVLVVLKGMESAASAIMKKINKIMRNINDYMKDASVQKIIADMEKVIAVLAASFERLTPENIANLMFRLCQMAQNLQAILMAPALRLNKVANSMASEAAALKSQNAVNVKEAVKHGAIRVSEDVRQSKKNNAYNKFKGIKPSNRETDYVIRSKPTTEEMSVINSVSESGLGSSITFSSAVIDSEGWKDINDNVYAKLLRIASQTGESYEVKTGFVERKKNDNMGAIAMNSHNSGYAIDIVVTESNRDDTVVAASRAGFTGIGIYTGHLHLDLGARRGWQKGFSGRQLTINQLLLDEHSTDSFKKKRS